MKKYRIKIAARRIVKSTSGYEYILKGVDIMYMTVEAENDSEAKDKVNARLKLMDLEGYLEDITEVKNA